LNARRDTALEMHLHKHTDVVVKYVKTSMHCNLRSRQSFWAY